jgi:hypothetical protein
MLLFLDCEWADAHGHELVSLGLVSEDGQHRFYAEVSPLPQEPNDFVRQVVYPLLEHGFAARQKDDFTRDLRAFLSRFPDAFVLFDYATDGVLLRDALLGFDLPEAVLAKLGPLPQTNLTLVARDEVRRLIEQYFQARPEAARRRHHAGVDADALRWAFQRAISTGTP